MRIVLLQSGVFFGVLGLGAAAAFGQAPVPAVSTSVFDQRTGPEIEKQAHEFLEQARKRPDGIVSVTLERYPGHYTMLTARTKPGGAELHQRFSDFFLVVDGEATELVGGTIPDGEETTPGEVRGTKVVGGTPHVMRKGDVIHIAPNTPHQTLVPDGGSFLYYVIKVQTPDSK